MSELKMANSNIKIGVAFATLALILALAPSANGDVVARYGGEFMAAGGGARSLALGGAYTAVSADAWALFWNPSGLADLDRAELGLMHSERFAGVVDYDAAAFASPQVDKSVLAAGLIRLGVNGIPFTRLQFPGQPISDLNRVEVDKVVNSGDYAFFVAKAARWQRWRWGVAPKLIFRHVGSDLRAYGLGLDVGAGGRPFVNLPVEAGVAVRDMLGTILAWEQTGRKELIVSTVRAGFSARINLPQLEAELTPVVDGVYRLENLGGSGAAEYHAGAEYLIRETLALRVGTDNGRLTVGGAMNLGSVSLDYAFVGHNQLGDSHRVSLTARWPEVR